MARDQLGIFDTPPDRREVRLALAIVGLLFAVFLLIFPVRDHRWAQVDAFMPTIDGIMLLGDLVTAALLYAQADVFRSRALTVLATGYAFAALLLIPHALTFPGAFSPDGLLGAGINTAGWIYYFRWAGVPVAVILYVQLKPADLAAQPGIRRPAASVTMAIAAALALAAAVTTLATIGHDLLPSLFVDRHELNHANLVTVNYALIALAIVATAMLFRQQKSVLDMWLLVALSGWLIQSLMLLLIEGRFTAGWYGLFGSLMFSHLVVMLALIAESSRLYARLALSTAARNREREARLMSMDAVAAAFSHEVGQPITGVLLNAVGSLNWLARPRPDVGMAIQSLHTTIEAGRRAADSMKTIRSIFADRPGRTTEFSLTDLVRETASLLDGELAGERISLQLVLDEALPPIRADRLQMQLVLVNLVTNAIESLDGKGGRPRRIAIRTMRLDGEGVLLEVCDTGSGIGPEAMEHIFDAFYTTKATGTGLGLSLCRTIVEEHGGRLWASQRGEYGAIFHMQLPPRPSLAVAE